MTTPLISQRELAELLGTTRSNINLHLSALKRGGFSVTETFVESVAVEGRRTVRRNVLKTDLQTAHAIAMRAMNVDAMNAIRLMAVKNGVELLPVVAMRREVCFSEMLRCLDGLFEIIPQYRFGRYTVDFFVPSVGLVIEYDERAHKRRRTHDASRQASIEREYGVSFVRVEEDNELEGFKTILEWLFSITPPPQHCRGHQGRQ